MEVCVVMTHSAHTEHIPICVCCDVVMRIFLHSCEQEQTDDSEEAGAVSGESQGTHIMWGIRQTEGESTRR